MKKLIYIFVALILASSLLPNINYSAPSSTLEIILESPNATEGELNDSKTIITQRLEAYGIGDFQVLVQTKDRELHIQLGDAFAQEPILPLLVSKGSLTFCATYSRSEISRILDLSVQNKAWETWLFPEMTSGEREADTPVIAALDPSKISGFFSFLENRENWSDLPPNLQFVAGRFTNQAGQMEVFALKYGSSDQTLVGGESVENASVQSHEASGSISIGLEFNEVGAVQWAEATRENMRRSVAVVIDDLVYMAPRVMAEITGGKAQITGDFTLEEARVIAAIISAGELPVEFSVKPDRR